MKIAYFPGMLKSSCTETVAWNVNARRGGRKGRLTPARRRAWDRRIRVARPDLPYTMKLPDGRTLYLEVPGRWVRTDRGGSPAFMPAAVEFLDRVRALAAKLDSPPSPGFIAALREALGATQAEFGEQLGVDKMTVSRWERGSLRPSDDSIKAIHRLRRKALRRGVTIPSSSTG